eukprot:7379588-Pyramimonas_sp.AAC.1
MYVVPCVMRVASTSTSENWPRGVKLSTLAPQDLRRGATTTSGCTTARHRNKGCACSGLRLEQPHMWKDLAWR